MNNLYTYAAVAAVAGSLGFAMGEFDLAVPEAAAKASEDRVPVRTTHVSTMQALQDIKAKVKAVHCALAEAEAEMNPDTCEVTPGTTTQIVWGDDTKPASLTSVDTRFLFGGQMVWDAQ